MADRGLWITWYDLAAEGRDAHLKWLHESYIPKMLKKPGFLHAAHYANGGVAPNPILRHTTDASVPAGNDYILIFGAETAHAFTRGWQSFAKGATPRLEEGLTAEDRRMLSMRTGERTGFFAEEARGNGPEAGKREGEYTLAPCIQLGSFQAPGCEDELMSWYGDWRIPALSRLPSCIAIRKLLSASAWAKHVVLYEFTSFDARAANIGKMASLYPEEMKWTEGFTPKLLHAPSSPVVGRRLWPAVK